MRGGASATTAIALAVLLIAPTAWAADSAARGTAEPAPSADNSGATRSGREIYRRFREGLADPTCAPDASTRWRSHFAAAPRRLASTRDDVLPLFGYVVDALREASLPTEYALIPFVESGYKPGAQSPLGPAGMWQMIKVTARNHHVSIRPGYDGRLSPIDSTRAAVRYLKTLHGMFAGDWRLAVMAYNAGEYRIFGALKRGGQVARSAQPEKLPGLPPITHAYVRKLHALSCLLEQAEDHEEWLEAIDRPVPWLRAVNVQPGTTLTEWASRNRQDADQLRRLNPALAGRRSGGDVQLLAPAGGTDEQSTTTTRSAPHAAAVMEPPTTAPLIADAPAPAPLTGAETSSAATAAAGLRQHTVLRGENASIIAHRHGVRVGELLLRNGLTPRSVLRPGMILRIDPATPAGQ